MVDHGPLGEAVIVSDHAGRFNVGTHALCRVHAERLIHKLVGFNHRQRQAIERIRARQPSSPGTRRGRTIQGQWTSAVLENVYECTSRDPDELEVWCYTDRLSYTPGDTVCFHVNTTVEPV